MNKNKKQSLSSIGGVLSNIVDPVVALPSCGTCVGSNVPSCKRCVACLKKRFLNEDVPGGCVQKICCKLGLKERLRRAPTFPDGWNYYFEKVDDNKGNISCDKRLRIVAPGDDNDDNTFRTPQSALESSKYSDELVRFGVNPIVFYESIGSSDQANEYRSSNKKPNTNTNTRSYSYEKTVGARVYSRYEKWGWFWGNIQTVIVDNKTKKKIQDGSITTATANNDYNIDFKYHILYEDGDQSIVADKVVCTELQYRVVHGKEPAQAKPAAVPERSGRSRRRSTIFTSADDDEDGNKKSSNKRIRRSSLSDLPDASDKKRKENSTNDGKVENENKKRTTQGKRKLDKTEQQQPAADKSEQQTMISNLKKKKKRKSAPGVLLKSNSSSSQSSRNNKVAKPSSSSKSLSSKSANDSFSKEEKKSKTFDKIPANTLTEKERKRNRRKLAEGTDITSEANSGAESSTTVLKTSEGTKTNRKTNNTEEVSGSRSQNMKQYIKGKSATTSELSAKTKGGKKKFLTISGYDRDQVGKDVKKQQHMPPPPLKKHKHLVKNHEEKYQRQQQKSSKHLLNTQVQKQKGAQGVDKKIQQQNQQKLSSPDQTKQMMPPQCKQMPHNSLLPKVNNEEGQWQQQQQPHHHNQQQKQQDMPINDVEMQHQQLKGASIQKLASPHQNSAQAQSQQSEGLHWDNDKQQQQQQSRPSAQGNLMQIPPKVEGSKPPLVQMKGTTTLIHNDDNHLVKMQEQQENLQKSFTMNSDRNNFALENDSGNKSTALVPTATMADKSDLSRSPSLSSSVFNDIRGEQSGHTNSNEAKVGDMEKRKLGKGPVFSPRKSTATGTSNLPRSVKILFNLREEIVIPNYQLNYNNLANEAKINNNNQHQLKKPPQGASSIEGRSAISENNKEHSLSRQLTQSRSEGRANNYLHAGNTKAVPPSTDIDEMNIYKQLLLLKQSKQEPIQSSDEQDQEHLQSSSAKPLRKRYHGPGETGLPPPSPKQPFKKRPQRNSELSNALLEDGENSKIESEDNSSAITEPINNEGNKEDEKHQELSDSNTINVKRDTNCHPLTKKKSYVSPGTSSSALVLRNGNSDSAEIDLTKKYLDSRKNANAGTPVKGGNTTSKNNFSSSNNNSAGDSKGNDEKTNTNASNGNKNAAGSSTTETMEEETTTSSSTTEVELTTITTSTTMIKKITTTKTKSFVSKSTTKRKKVANRTYRIF